MSSLVVNNSVENNSVENNSNTTNPALNPLGIVSVPIPTPAPLPLTPLTSPCVLYLSLPHHSPSSGGAAATPVSRFTINALHAILPSSKFTGVTGLPPGVHLLAWKFCFPATKGGGGGGGSGGGNGGGGGVAHGMFVDVPLVVVGSVPLALDFVVRHFDVLTEEVSPYPFPPCGGGGVGGVSESGVREACGEAVGVNWGRIGGGGEGERGKKLLEGIVRYDDVVSLGEDRGRDGSNGSYGTLGKGKSNLMRFITKDVLESMGIRMGHKIIPGVWDGDLDPDELKEKAKASEDGMTIPYNLPIPIPLSSLPSSPGSGSPTKGEESSANSGVNSRVKVPKETLEFFKLLTASERTSCSLDSSRLLSRVISKNSGHGRTLAEMELTYLAFTGLECWRSFERWKRLVVLVSKGCEEWSWDGDGDGEAEAVEFFGEAIGIFARQLTAGVCDDIITDAEAGSFVGDGLSGEGEGEEQGGFLRKAVVWFCVGVERMLGYARDSPAVMKGGGKKDKLSEYCGYFEELVAIGEGKFGVKRGGTVLDTDSGGGGGGWGEGWRKDSEDDDLPVVVDVPSSYSMEEEGVEEGRKGRKRTSSFAEECNKEVIYSDSNDNGSRMNDDDDGGGGDDPAPPTSTLASTLADTTDVIRIRYPNLYLELKKSGGREDAMMLCARLIEEREREGGLWGRRELSQEVEAFLSEYE